MQLDFSIIKNIVVLGAGESGVGAALLAQKEGFDVFVSDYGKIAASYQKELDQNKILFEAEQHSLNRILEADLVIKSPGIPEKASVVQQLRHKKIPIVDEVEFAVYFTDAKIIGITGSNGKTTTTRLIHHVLKAAGYKAGLAGNVGYSLAKQVATQKQDVYVVELSSFQLDNCHTFAPDIAVLLNITPDHLDRYEYRMENYANSKLRITSAQSAEGKLIYNSSDENIRQAMLRKGPLAQRIPCAMDEISGQSEWLKVARTTIKLETSRLPLKGKHNYFNITCAVLALHHFGVAEETIKQHLGSFINEAHRLETVVTINDVEFINDSKATNVEAAYYALQAMTKPVVWIAGGIDKGNDYTALFSLVKEKVRAIVCLGKDNSKIIEAFGDKHEIIVETRQIEEAIKLATLYAEPGDVVLLAPACSSFDLFENYKARGNQFKACLLSQAEIINKGAQAQINLNIKLDTEGESNSDVL